MDLSPAQQKAVFVLIVVVLAALGYWLLLPKLTHTASPSLPRPTVTPSSVAPPSGTAAAGGSAPAQAPPAATVSPTAAGNVNIYSWLPFTQQDLAAAAAVTVRFGRDYNTYTYTESPQAYVATMNGLITGAMATKLQASYTTPGVANLRKSQQQVSTGTATIISLRAFGASSLTFVVTAGQHLVSSGKASNGSAQYAITVIGSGTGWQVNDIELASVGNF